MKAFTPFLYLLLFLLFANTFFAQEQRFFMPKEMMSAYENGTRSYDGKPGPNYWHNTVDYDIDVEVVPEEQKLQGAEKVTYHNNSPDELNFIVIRLYHDVFRGANPRAYRVDSDDITDGVTISKMTIEGSEIEMSDNPNIQRQGTNMTVVLPAPVPSGEKLDLEIEWSQYIPNTTVRTGAYDSTSYFLAYWYPQVAVYDDIFGWDMLAYDFSTEFYNNLGNYDVRITAPKQYTVLSTGELQNADKVLTAEHLKRYNQAKTAKETVTIVGPEDLEKGLQHQSGTWHYAASEVADFAFCLSDHYCWDAASQKVDDRTVFISTYYPLELREPAAAVTPNQQKMMKHFSEEIPGIAYPYPEFTTFISGAGGGGMEYPMMANNGGPGLGVTVHEMFHTYFPMYVRTNEKRFAWMDEGWADFTTSFLIRRFFEENEKTPLFGAFSTQVQGNMGSISDLPLITSTQFMDGTNYGYASYPLPAFLYAVIYDHLGEDMFLKCWREYIRRWAKKSPTPYDFIYTFETVSGQDLNWFWQPWFFNFGSVDVYVDSYKKGKLKLKNKGTRPVPISLRVKYKDGTESTSTYSAKSWDEDRAFMVKLPRKKEIASIDVNYNVADAELLDNFYPSLQERYGDFTIPKSMLGRYQLNEFPVPVFITEKDGLLNLSVPAGGIDTYLVRKADGNFESLNGEMQVQFEMEDDIYTGINIQVSGMRITGRK